MVFLLGVFAVDLSITHHRAVIREELRKREITSIIHPGMKRPEVESVLLNMTSKSIFLEVNSELSCILAPDPDDQFEIWMAVHVAFDDADRVSTVELHRSYPRPVKARVLTLPMLPYTLVLQHRIQVDYGYRLFVHLCASALTFQ